VRTDLNLPGRGFLLLLFFAGLYLLFMDLRFESRRSPTPDEVIRSWVHLLDDEFGQRFEPIHPGDRLGNLVMRILHERIPFLSDACKRVLLEPGTRIRLRKCTGSEAITCNVSRLPERCRYLLGLPINLNLATTEEMVLLPGIGPARAERIVRAREKRGEFSTLHELLDVRGIGGKTLDRIRGRSTVK